MESRTKSSFASGTAPNEEQRSQKKNRFRWGDDIIEPFDATAYSQVLLQPKPHTIDYHRLNALTEVESWPLPYTEHMFERIAANCAKFFRQEFHSGFLSGFLSSGIAPSLSTLKCVYNLLWYILVQTRSIRPGKCAMLLSAITSVYHTNWSALSNLRDLCQWLDRIRRKRRRLHSKLPPYIWTSSQIQVCTQAMQMPIRFNQNRIRRKSSILWRIYNARWNYPQSHRLSSTHKSQTTLKLHWSSLVL